MKCMLKSATWLTTFLDLLQKLSKAKEMQFEISLLLLVKNEFMQSNSSVEISLTLQTPPLISPLPSLVNPNKVTLNQMNPQKDAEFWLIPKSQSALQTKK